MTDMCGSNLIAWIAAEADETEDPKSPPFVKDAKDGPPLALPAAGMVAHQFPSRAVKIEESAPCPPFAKDAKDGAPTESPSPLPATDPGNGVPGESFDLDAVESAAEIADRNFDEDRERRIYRARTVAMLRRYMRYSIETGRLPSVLGGEFFRAKMTTYTVVTFEDRVIFVHDMEKCLARLDEFSRQLIARHILQDHDQEATGKLLHCTERTVRTYVPVVLDLFSQILVEVGLLERVDSKSKKSCQGGKNGPFPASDCEEGKYKF